ncbi:glycosyltransferase involved in cell wall biosynthesis [Rhodoblastus sphagnicola]|uniref:glycosyltransferase n=1 Tax=Rhodoblastus sphagnicola TaxID=333368 RepID=UPI00161A4E0B|nr:glycosyltransferase [Rhodoblastus sphagnicola]MBB4201105.1 glycosyltransferase involved in cell wall biosynthesis [Rhodoblastus sphagnicola]
MSNNACVSVIIPSFNHREYVGRAIESVLSQTYPHIECIIIDDGSEDGSFEYIVDRFGSHSCVKVEKRENRGAYKTINDAIDLSSGEYISILNSDDYYDIKRVEAFIDEAARHDGPFFAISALHMVDKNGDVFDSTSPYNHYYDTFCALSAGKADIFGFWCGNIAMTTSNFFFSKSVFLDVGPFRALRYSHDWDWALRAASKFNVHRLPEKLLSYRIHGANTILEKDDLGHVIDDAFVWASALRRDKIDLQKHFITSSDASFFKTLLVNSGFYPLATLYLIADQRSEVEQLRIIENGTLKNELKNVFKDALLDPLFGQSMSQLMRSFREKHGDLSAESVRDCQIGSSDANALSGELSLIRKSTFWIFFGWIWRLETRGVRKSRRSALRAG